MRQAYKSVRAADDAEQGAGHRGGALEGDPQGGAREAKVRAETAGAAGCMANTVRPSVTASSATRALKLALSFPRFDMV
ncbi:hypothetical protein [Paracoccus shandongensis]|uniref:hypothetical protein n=1 Tax=Paracoccus shandongensis TaxID=2816048 RepID=UPI001A8E22DB|nr:hypothetical protein [Paracoccus shandongensis]